MKNKNGYNCIVCNKELVGKQRKHCSIACRQAYGNNKKRQKRANETPEEKEARKAEQNQCAQKHRDNLSPEKKSLKNKLAKEIYHKNMSTHEGREKIREYGRKQSSLPSTKAYHQAYNNHPVVKARQRQKKRNEEVHQPDLVKEKKAIANSRRAKYQKKNPAYYAMKKAERKAKEKRAILPTTDIALINQIYKESREISEKTGTPHQVDHKIPLHIGGAHHQDNLRIIPASENAKKKAKYDPSLGGKWANNELAKVTRKNLEEMSPFL
jgi:hypothetical protein